MEREYVDIDIDELKVEIDWPMIARIRDDLFEYHGYDHVRYTARALIENEKGEFGFLHIVGEDFFGVRDHLETCGGGLEENEDLITCIIREIEEEMGLKVSEPELIGSILDAYNLIGRITLSTFFYCKADTSQMKRFNRTEEEKILIREIVWLSPEEALKRLKNGAKSKVDMIVQRRDLDALEYYLNNRNKK